METNSEEKIKHFTIFKKDYPNLLNNSHNLHIIIGFQVFLSNKNNFQTDLFDL